MLFEEVQDTGNARLLLVLCTAKGVPVHMDVKAACPRLMAFIAHCNGLVQYVRPSHPFPVVVQCHRVGDNFKPLLQRTVMLAIDVLIAAVGNAQQFCGIAGGFSAIINLQFYAHVPASLSVKDRVRLVVVVLNPPLHHRTGIAVMAKRFFLARVIL